MIKNEKYIRILKSMISCVNNGDYYSIKELSVLEINTLKKETVLMKENLHKYIESNLCKKELKNLEKQEFLYIVNLYVEYLFNEIKESKEVKKIASIEEFIQEIQ